VQRQKFSEAFRYSTNLKQAFAAEAAGKKTTAKKANKRNKETRKNEERKNRK
jgi:hypothetical protein